ncbi:hypothetical protein fugu_016537 [Takifugu bimaculatus]|uniref:Uncharacterized protein n=1 Tax=Takifugu bimaculatus TaxID=433685 RepID=A0A4Z2BT95_9TELE|nr:hypothetical protein fugu_016537 [Takifugu bimaculatus]
MNTQQLKVLFWHLYKGPWNAASSDNLSLGSKGPQPGHCLHQLRLIVDLSACPGLHHDNNMPGISVCSFPVLGSGCSRSNDAVNISPAFPHPQLVCADPSLPRGRADRVVVRAEWKKKRKHLQKTFRETTCARRLSRILFE